MHAQNKLVLGLFICDVACVCYVLFMSCPISHACEGAGLRVARGTR